MQYEQILKGASGAPRWRGEAGPTRGGVHRPRGCLCPQGFDHHHQCCQHHHHYRQ